MHGGRNGLFSEVACPEHNKCSIRCLDEHYPRMVTTLSFVQQLAHVLLEEQKTASPRAHLHQEATRSSLPFLFLKSE